ncbi:MAG: hypothetical protein WAM09_12970 [Anaerolineales bacterium]|jgi:membrane protein implicated in regulation of membrane protease activity
MFPGLLGFFAGAIIYGLIYPQVFPLISKIANVGNVVLPDLWNLNPYLAVFLFALIAIFLFYLIDRAGLQRKDKGE